jgi:hypothetical protein
LLILAVFSLIHALDDHAHESGDACPACAQIASAHEVFRQFGTAMKCAVFLFFAVYTAVHDFKPALPRADIHTLIALKIQLNT